MADTEFGSSTGGMRFAGQTVDLFRRAMDQVDEIFIITSSRRTADGAIADFEYTYLNEAAVRMMGRPAEEILGHGLVELFPSHVPSGLFDAYRDAVVSGEPGHVSIPTFDENGVSGSFLVDVFPFGDGYVMIGRDVTEQTHRERELRASREEYRLLAENTSDVVYRTDAEGILIWISPSVERTLGWKPADLVGTDTWTLLHPDDLPLAEAAVTAGQRDGSGHATVRFRTRDGTFRWMQGSVARLRGHDGASAGHVIGLRDVHERTVAEQALAESAVLFQTAVHSAAIGMAIVGADGRLIEVNRALGALLDYPEEELFGESFQQFVHEDDRVRLVSGMPPLAASATVLSDLRLLRRGGGTIWTRCAVVALQSSDRAPTRYLIQVEDVTAERWAKQELEYRAFHDQLTGLRNRAWILDILPNELQSARQSGLDVGLMLIDLDEFKVVNDSMGHSAGDELLVLVSERLASVVPSDCHLGRTGGDEFVVVAPDITTPLEMETLAERVTDGLAEAVTLHGHHVVPSASIGISTSSSESTAESLLRDADSALFRAKAGGRGRWQFADSEMHRQAVDRITLVEEIRDGITRREFVAHFMPIVALEDRRIRGHEALVRWHHPTRGLLNPADFLPLAEETGLIREIGDLMLADVCRRMADRPDLQGCMSVNISAVQLRQPQWIAQFRETLQRFGVPPDRMVIEITETSVLSLMQSTLSDLTALRGIGVGVHLDDFGTGYSPISLLREVPVSELKLDASFVRDLTDGDTRATAIASSLAQLAHGLGIVGIAEGVETAEHASILASMGWEFGQGFHFGRPDPELTASLA